jgi:hypothetical protein
MRIRLEVAQPIATLHDGKRFQRPFDGTEAQLNDSCIVASALNLVNGSEKLTPFGQLCLPVLVRINLRFSRWNAMPLLVESVDGRVKCLPDGVGITAVTARKPTPSGRGGSACAPCDNPPIPALPTPPTYSKLLIKSSYYCDVWRGR